MKTSENKEKKQLRELSEEELKEVTGGSSIDCSQPENRVLPVCKDLRKVQIMGVGLEGVIVNVID